MQSGHVTEPIQEVIIWREDYDGSKSSSLSSDKTDLHNDEKQSDSEPEKNEIELYFLKNMSSNITDELIVLYNQSVEVLEKNICDYKWSYRVFYSLYTTTIATNFLECFFLIDTAKEGVKTFSNYFFGIEVVPDVLIYFIGIPWALTDLLVYAVVISAHTEAIKSTLAYILQPSLKNQVKQFISELIQDPLKKLSNSSYNLLNHFILLSCNVTESLSDIIAINWFTKNPIQFYQWTTMAIILFLGNLFNSKFTNPDYREGLIFWKNKDKLPYIFEKLLSGHFLIPLQIFIQGCCVVGLEAFPLTYYLSQEAEKQLGGWLPPYLTSSLSIIHSLCVLYPATYFYYMEDDIELSNLIRKKSGHQIESDIRKNSKNVTIFNESAIKHEVSMEIEKIKNHLKSEIATNEKYGYVFVHRPELLFSMIVYGLAGGFLGYLVLNPLFLMVADDLTSSKIGSTLIGGALFSACFYRIEKDIYNTQLVIKKINHEEQASTEKNVENRPSACSSKCETILAITFNLGSSLLSFASIIGSESKINSRSTLLPAVMFAGAQRMSNNIAFLKEKLADNVHSAVKTVHTFFKGTVCTFFYRKTTHTASSEPTKNISLHTIVAKK